ncbi:response regulator [Vibrio pacinii]|uniref:response regulator n=1 Tax=Vibrio pacinii TaxID=170674 RepID=UPI00057030D8|nr:response regulator [Vibrio pacinii]
MADFDPTNFTLLVVEDHAFSRKALINMLVKNGYENLLSASNGEKALDKLNHNQIDLIITDINMPNINGLELIKMVREGKTSVAKDTSIIAVTTLSDTPTISACMTLEVDSFLVKPITVSSAQQQIKNAVSEPKCLYQQHLYHSVSTAVTFEQVNSKPDSTSPRISEVSSHIVKIEKLSELKEGMVLLEDIHVISGGSLVKAGTTLNAKLLRRLFELGNVIKINPICARVDQAQMVT